MGTKELSIIRKSLFTLGALSSLAQADPLIDLVQYGLQKSFTIKSQQLRLEQAQNTNTSAYFQLLPSIQASGTRSYQVAQGVSEEAISTTKTDGIAGKLNATWTLWDNFQNITDIRVARIGLISEEIQTDKEMQLYVISLLDAFIEYQVLHFQREITKGFLKQSQWVLGESATLARLGAKSRFETLDAEIQTLNAERDLREVELSLESAKRNLKNLLNSDPSFQIPIIDLLKLKPFYMSRLDVKKVNEWSSNTDALPVVHNRELRLASLNLDKSSAELTQTSLDYFPKTSFQISQDLNLDRVITKRNGPPYTGLNSTTYSLQLSWQLWDWWITPRKIKNSRLSHEISTYSLQETKNKAESEFLALLDQYGIVEQSIEGSKKVLDKAVQHLEYSREMYKLGKLNNLSIQKANSTLYEAQLAVAQRLKQKFILAAKIIYSSGSSLLPDSNQSEP